MMNYGWDMKHQALIPDRKLNGPPGDYLDNVEQWADLKLVPGDILLATQWFMLMFIQQVVN